MATKLCILCKKGGFLGTCSSCDALYCADCYDKVWSYHYECDKCKRLPFRVRAPFYGNEPTPSTESENGPPLEMFTEKVNKMTEAILRYTEVSELGSRAFSIRFEDFDAPGIDKDEYMKLLCRNYYHQIIVKKISTRGGDNLVTVRLQLKEMGWKMKVKVYKECKQLGDDTVMFYIFQQLKKDDKLVNQVVNSYDFSSQFSEGEPWARVTLKIPKHIAERVNERSGNVLEYFTSQANEIADLASHKLNKRGGMEGVYLELVQGPSFPSRGGIFTGIGRDERDFMVLEATYNVIHPPKKDNKRAREE